MIRHTLYVGLSYSPTDDVVEEWSEETVVRALERQFPLGLTVIFGVGSWQGQRERSAVVTILRPNTPEQPAHDTMRLAVDALRRELCQTAILWTRETVTGEEVRHA